MSEVRDEGTPRKSHVTSLPSDYSDVQPDHYDPEYITQISSKMQVPYSIGAKEGEIETEDTPHDPYEQYGHSMMVPERILVAGEGQHVGAREGLRPLKFETFQESHLSSYVGLLTPPRTLTVEEALPHTDMSEGRMTGDTSKNNPNDSMPHAVPNGSIFGMQPIPPFSPGNSMNNSLIHTEHDLHTTVAKLSRRVKVLEEEGQRRWLSDFILYVLVGGTVLKNIVGWLIRSRD